MKKLIFLLIVAGLIAIPVSLHGAISLPYTFSAGTTIKSAEVNANFANIRDVYNPHEASVNGHNTDLEDVLSIDPGVTTPIDFNLTQGVELRVENLAADPTCNGGSAGRVIWNTVESLYKICNGTAWVTVAGTGVNTLANVLISGNSAGATDINMNQNELLSARIENLVGDPAPGNTGRLWYNTTSSEVKVDTGAAVIALGGAQGLASVLGISNSAGAVDIDFNGNEALNMLLHTAAVAPAGSDGQLYFDTVSDDVFVYHSGIWNLFGNTNSFAQTLLIGNSAGATDIDFNGNYAINMEIENLVNDIGSPALGRIWYNTTDNRMRYGVAGVPAVRTILTETDTQTVSGKSISGATNTFTNIPDGALSANVDLLDGNQTITGTKTFSTVPVIPNILGGGVGAVGHVVPNVADDTFILKDAIQQMTNKGFADSVSIFGTLDMNVKEIENFLVDNVAIEPAAGNAGRLVYKTATGELLYEDGINWFKIGIGSTPTWSQVLAIGNSAGGTDPDVNLREMLNMRAENLAAPLPAFGNDGRLAFNTTDSTMYYDDGTQWKRFVSDWAEALANGASAGATDPDVNNRQMLNMRLENIAGDPAPAQVGRVYYNTVSTFPKYDDGAAVHEFVDDDSVQTVAGKTMVATDNNITLPVVGVPTYTTIEDSNTVFNSAGQISGGVISDAGGATIDVSAGTGAIRIANTDVSEVRFFDWGAALAQAIPADTTRYIGVEYNAGTPQVSIRAADNFNGNDDFTLGVVVNEAGTLHISEHEQNVANAVKNIFDRFNGVEPIVRDEKVGGLILDETGARNITVSAGNLWTALHSHSISSLDTSGADDFDRYYGSFTKQSAQTQWDNANYDNAGVLTALSANRYSNQYFYLETDGALVSIYGRAQYTVLAQAQAEAAPNGLPDRLDEHAILIGRVVFQEGSGSASAVETVFDTTFSATVTTDHGSLAGLSDDDHALYFNINGRAGGQQAYGGTASGNDLILTSNTSNDGEVEIEDQLRMDFNPGTQEYVWSNTETDTDDLVLQGQTSGQPAVLSIHSADGDSTDNTGIRIFGNGVPGAALRNWLYMGVYTARSAFSVKPFAAGGSGQKSLFLGASNNAEVMVIDTNSRVGIGAVTPDGKLEVDGDDDEITLAVDADAGQTANIQEWRDSAETTLSYIDVSGNLFAPKAGIDELAEKTGSAGINVTSAFEVNHELSYLQDNEATTGNIDALDNTGKTSIRLTGAGAVTLRGIDDGTDGKILTVANVTGNDLTILDQDANPAAADRILTGVGADIVVADTGAISFQYDSTTQRWRVLGGPGGGGGGGLSPTGTRGSPQNIVAGTGVLYVEDANNPRQIWYIQGNGGAVDITANPQIAAPASLINQELVLIGRSDTNTVKFDHGAGLDLNGSYTMGAGDALVLFYDGTNFSELSRR